MLPVAVAILQSLPGMLDSVLDDAIVKHAACAAYVTKLDGAVIYDRNSSMRLMPASNEKLFTTAWALHDLGTTYRPETRFWKLPDRIVIDTTGDPMLTHDDLDHAKKELGITKPLPVYVREPYRVGYLPEWTYDDLPNKYAAPVTAFTVDRGSFAVCMDKDKAFCEPEAYDLKIVRHISGSEHVKYDPFTKTIQVYGPLPSKVKTLDTLSLPEPDREAASIIGEGFHDATDVPATAPDLVLQGPFLPAIIKECLVHSDNNLAENLFMLAALGQGPLGEDPYDTARQRESAFLTKTVGLEGDEVRPDDGSGLSRYNWVTAHSIGKLLQWESTQPTYDLWKGSLASPGNGTLKDRLKDSSFVGKTGTMTGVSALSGYVKTKDGQPVIVSMLFNNYTCHSDKIRAIQDQFIRKIEATSWSGTVLEGNDQRESALAVASPGFIPFYRIH